MTRHGISHGGATLVSMVTAALLIGHAQKHVPLLLQRLERVAIRLKHEFSLDLEVETLSAILIASVLASLWGIAFARMNQSR